jgi:phage baseplate assembly protein W
MSDQDEFLGVGWSFPPKFNKFENGVNMLVGKAAVENCIQLIVRTKLGERILRNEFGSRIYELVFEPLNANMKTYMASSLKIALETNEPRIKNVKAVLTQPDQSIGRVDIAIEYVLIETNETNNLVVPFYTPENVSIN